MATHGTKITDRLIIEYTRHGHYKENKHYQFMYVVYVLYKDSSFVDGFPC